MAGVTRGFTGRRSAGRDGRLPPGQYDVGKDWPVLTAEVTPKLATDAWNFSVEGLVARPTTWWTRSVVDNARPSVPSHNINKFGLR